MVIPRISTWGPDYDLVRIHHPDSPITRSLGLSPEVAHTRFQSISRAYDALRGKIPQASINSESKHRNDTRTATWRNTQSSRPDLDFAPDERWKDGVIIGGIVLVHAFTPYIFINSHSLQTIGLFVFQTAITRRQALADAAKKSRLLKDTSNSSHPRNAESEQR
jgi:hypothetical protein